ncbi:MAG TPA: hypothetical protein VFE10_00600 [Phenylobacterium sp.]|jgi:hypothetical protein|nr:hypothetical protein [Phenylobacterium sp.]
MQRPRPVRSALAGLLAALAVQMPGAAATAAEPDNVYATFGVHSDAHADDCAAMGCVYKRAPTEPTDPAYPRWWTSHWAMYRVFNQFTDNLRPYAGKPPAALRDGIDYQTSWGITYYDSTWTGPSGRGAMEEHYDRFCLPIFPIPNNYSCSFISLGETAYFVTFDDRPGWMPKACLFSPRNHPPERDFVRHLPYAPGDSRRPGLKIQGYSFWISQAGRVLRAGASPDMTEQGGILFGYAFERQARPDRVDKTAPPYRHPQSFYFSGVPKLPQAPLPDAPIVSQNYTDFAMIRPDPAKTWAQVSSLDPKTLPESRLFDPPAAASPASAAALTSLRPVPTWNSLGRH